MDPEMRLGDDGSRRISGIVYGLMISLLCSIPYPITCHSRMSEFLEELDRATNQPH